MLRTDAREKGRKSGKGDDMREKVRRDYERWRVRRKYTQRSEQRGREGRVKTEWRMWKE